MTVLDADGRAARIRDLGPTSFNVSLVTTPLGPFAAYQSAASPASPATADAFARREATRHEVTRDEVTRHKLGQPEAWGADTCSDV